MAGGRVVRSAGRPNFGRPSRPKAPTPRFDGDRLKKIARWTVLLIAVLTLWRAFNVKQVVVKGNRTVSSQELSKAIESSLRRRPWGYNLLTVSQARLSLDLKAGDYRIKEVSIARQWPQVLVVTVTERQPSLNWSTGGQVYLLDLDGSIIGPPDPNQHLATVIDSTNLPVKAGDRVVPPSFMRFTADLLANLPKRTSLNAMELRVPDTTSELYVTTNRKFMIKFDTTRSAGDQLSDLVGVLATLDKQHKTPAEYIDLRISGKAYYR